MMQLRGRVLLDLSEEHQTISRKRAKTRYSFRRWRKNNVSTLESKRNSGRMPWTAKAYFPVQASNDVREHLQRSSGERKRVPRCFPLLVTWKIWQNLTKAVHSGGVKVSMVFLLTRFCVVYIMFVSFVTNKKIFQVVYRFHIKFFELIVLASWLGKTILISMFSSQKLVQ